MNDPFQPSPDAECLAELSGLLREAVQGVKAEPVSDAAVATVADRAKRLAWAESDEASGLTPRSRADGRDVNGREMFHGGTDSVARHPIAGLADDAVCIVVKSAPFPGSSRSLLGYFSQIGPFSYAVSALIMGFALIVAWQCQITERLKQLEIVSRAQSKMQPQTASAGCVSAMDGCQWAKDFTPSKDAANAQTFPTVDSHLATGQQIKLDAGLMEITYETGAKVILQGPAAFDVDANGGFLAVGRLTGRLETRAKPSNPQSPIPNPFAIRTPTALVTDLGTEFGVEVDRDGYTSSYVFRGSIEVRTAVADHNEQAVVLWANESIRVGVADNHLPVIDRVEVDPSRFVRRVSNRRRIPIKMFNTGLRLQEGQADPHWQVVAISSDPGFKPRAAFVIVAQRNWIGNEPNKSQWISTPADRLEHLQSGAVYTFRTTFALNGVLPNTAVVQGWFVVNRHVEGIRLNGESVPIPEHREPAHKLYYKFRIDHGFIEGTNVLDFDVTNSGTSSPSEPLSAMAFRVDLEGTAQEQ